MFGVVRVAYSYIAVAWKPLKEIIDPTGFRLTRLRARLVSLKSVYVAPMVDNKELKLGSSMLPKF